LNEKDIKSFINASNASKSNATVASPKSNISKHRRSGSDMGKNAELSSNTPTSPTMNNNHSVKEERGLRPQPISPVPAVPGQEEMSRSFSSSSNESNQSSGSMNSVFKKKIFYFFLFFFLFFFLLFFFKINFLFLFF
jgi:hypothetical protein